MSFKTMCLIIDFIKIDDFYLKILGKDEKMIIVYDQQLQTYFVGKGGNKVYEVSNEKVIEDIIKRHFNGRIKINYNKGKVVI